MSREQAKPLAREKGSFISHVATLATGTAVSQIVSVVALLLLTRLFAPQAFGLLALFMSIVSFLSVLGGARYELAIMLPETDREAANVFGLAVLILSGICGLCFLLVAILHHDIATLFSDPHLEPWLWSVPAVIFVNGLSQVIAFWCGRMKRFHLLAISRMVQATCTVGAQIALFYVHVNAGIALIGGWIFGQTLGMLVLAGHTAFKDSAFLRSSWNHRSMTDLVKKYRNFPFYKAPYSFISNASSQLIVIVIRLFSTLSTVGLFSMAYRAIYLPVSLITSSMNQVFYEKAATESETGGLEDFVNKTLRTQVILATPLLILAVAESRLLFSTVFGPRWSQGGAFAAFLAFAGFMYFITGWLDRLFDVRGRQRLSLAIEIAGNLGSLGALSLTLLLTDNALWAVGLFTVSEVIYSCFWLKYAYQVAGFKSNALWQLAKDFAMAGIPVALVVGTLHLMVHGLVALAFSIGFVLVLEAFYFVRYVHGAHMFNSTVDRFRTFWLDKTSPLHKSDSTEFYRSCVGELRAFFPSAPLSAVLEIGCGDGSMFPHLNVPPMQYTGVDFSPAMIEVFRSRHPNLRLLCAEGSSYMDGQNQYDLIFSHGVVQHFDLEMLREHLQNARRMMHAGSVLICGSILDKSQRNNYDSGMSTKRTVSRLIRFAKSRVASILGRDHMGFWYRKQDLAAIARAIGFESAFVQSRVYPYRFHAAFRLQEKSNEHSHLKMKELGQESYRVFPLRSTGFGL